MASININHNDVDERAFSIFVIEGLHYLLQQDVPLRHGHIIDFCNRLWMRWTHLPESEKDPYWERASEELRRMRRNTRVDIYRDALRDQSPPGGEDNQRRRRFMNHSS